MVEKLVITAKTRISEIVERYGDLSRLMAALGLSPVGSVVLRPQLMKFLTVERAAAVQRIPLEKLLALLRVAIAQAEARREAPHG